jgi:DNA polymerase III epsilon subunit family exonuclease
MSNRFAVIDFETTGLSPNNGERITEVAIVIVESGKVIDQFESLVNTGKSIPYEIQSLTGITNQMTANAPTASVIIPQVHQFIKNSTLVAHNASFDSKFFHSEMYKVGIKANVDFICTLLLSRRLYPSLENHKLGTLAKYHGIKSQGKSHRALADALVTAELFIQISNDLREHLSTNNLTAHQYLHSQKQPLSSFSKPKRQAPIASFNNQSTTYATQFKQLSRKLDPVNLNTDQKLNISSQITTQTKSPGLNVPKTDIKLANSEGVKWQKTKSGLVHKVTGIFIPFTDTLRDAFPISGYQIKGHHPFDFIKDSEIENVSPESTSLSIEVIPQKIKNVVNFLKPKSQQKEAQEKHSPGIQKVSALQNGFGQTTLPNGDKYEGNFSNGKRHGHGIYRWSNGSTYEGEWVQGEITGNGKKVFSSGAINSGTFVNGELNGHGTQIFSPSGEWKGDKYIGEFVNGIREGLGTYTWSNGTTYAGQWLAGKMHGNGTKKMADGSIDTGIFNDGLLEGLGTRVWKTDNDLEERYEGSFKNGLRHGRGLHLFSNGDRYDGDWAEDLRSGNGTYTWTNGDQYSGEWIKGKMAGKGLLTWKNGDTHKGNFANGLRHGKGIYKTTSGEQYSGVWLAGEFDRECTYNDSDGNFYEGEFKDYRFHGLGTFIWKNGARYDGVFSNGLRHGAGYFTTKSKTKHSGQWKLGILTEAYDEWIERESAKFNAQFKKLKTLKEACFGHTEKWKNIQHAQNKGNENQEEFITACQSLVERLDFTLADYDGFRGEFYIDIEKCSFCCYEEIYKEQIDNRLTDRIKHITALRNDLYKIYLDLIELTSDI